MPRLSPDFNWLDVPATVGTFPKGTYEITISRVSGSVRTRTDLTGQTEELIVVRLLPKMVGVYDSSGRLSYTLDGKEISGIPCEDINLWLHSTGGARMAKKFVMAILGYNPNNPRDEEKFHRFVSTSELDFQYDVVESDTGEPILQLRPGWDILVGKNVVAMMDEEIRQIGGEQVISQRYVRLSPLK